MQLVDWGKGSTELITYTGVWVGFIYVISMNWWRWKTITSQHAFTTLQSLRTNNNYLEYASVVQREVGKLGEELNDDLVAEVLERAPRGDEDKPSFHEASAFLLNQYEFIAASARLGAMDMALLEKTAKSTIRDLTKTYAPVIRKLRSKNISTFENLVWLYREFTDDWKTDFGDFDYIPQWLRAK